MDEKWLPVQGLEGRYSVSDAGRILRHASQTRNRIAAYTLPERFIPPTLCNGYLVVNLWRANKYTRWLVHRLVVATFLGPSKLSVDHINGDTADNRLSNLRYCTLAANTRFQHEAGRVRFVRGEENGKSRLTEAKVREARQMIASGETSKAVGARLGVAKETIQAMRNGRTWGHVI